MQYHNNTMLITGGGSGIGRGLAEAFHRLGNKVIITGRRKDVLDQTCEANPGMRYFVMDVADPASVARTAVDVAAELPALNCLINNAGVQIPQDFSGDRPLDEAALAQELQINVAGLIRTCAAFLPQLKKQRNGIIINVTSGLAFVPMARFPTYCATKAAVHSFTLSLRHQLKPSGVRVVELIPPWVATELGGSDKPTTLGDRKPMPLDPFITQAMQGLGTDQDEVAVADAQYLMNATNPAGVAKVFAAINRE